MSVEAIVRTFRTTLIANYIALVKEKCIWLQVCVHYLLGKHTYSLSQKTCFKLPQQSGAPF